VNHFDIARPRASASLLSICSSVQDLRHKGHHRHHSVLEIVKKKGIIDRRFRTSHGSGDRGLGAVRSDQEGGACFRFHRIMMTKLAALSGALPLGVRQRGLGPKLRSTLGVAIVGGLVIIARCDPVHHHRGLSRI